MNGSTRRQSVIVGLFVLFGLVILAGAVLAISEPEIAFGRSINVKARFDEVSGLMVGNNVWFSGVKVGTVSAMRFTDDRKVEVELSLHSDAGEIIRADTRAKIGADGLIGNRIVVLYDGTDTARPIQEGDVIEVTPLLSPEDVLTVVQQNNENLLAITQNLRALTEAVSGGQGTAGKLLTDEQLYWEVVSATRSFQEAGKSAKDAGQAITDTARSFQATSERANEVVATLHTFADTVNRDGTRVLDGIAVGTTDTTTPIGLLLQDREAGQDLSTTIENLERGSALLAEDLEALQHNFLFRGYFKKKAKREQELQERQPEPVAPPAPPTPADEPRDQPISP